MLTDIRIVIHTAKGDIDATSVPVQSSRDSCEFPEPGIPQIL